MSDTPVNSSTRSKSSVHVDAHDPVDPRNAGRYDPDFTIRAGFPGDEWDANSGDVFNLGS